MGHCWWGRQPQFSDKHDFSRTGASTVGGIGGAAASTVHKLLGNFSATLGFLSNFQFVEQLSVQAFKLLCLDIHSYAPATSETN